MSKFQYPKFKIGERMVTVFRKKQESFHIGLIGIWYLKALSLCKMVFLDTSLLTKERYSACLDSAS